MALILKETHPFAQKVAKLYEVMEELGITIEYGGSGCLNIVDNQSNTHYRLKDRDSGEHKPTFPTGVEYKLSKEDYL